MFGRRALELLVVVIVVGTIAWVLWPRGQASPLVGGTTPPPTVSADAQSIATISPATTSPESFVAEPPPMSPQEVPTEVVRSATPLASMPQPAPTGYSVSIDHGLNLKWSAADAALAAATFIEVTEERVGRALEPLRVISVEAMSGSNEPKSVGGPDPDIPAVWIVHSNGTFINDHGPAQYLYNEGWFIYDDRDGSMLGEALQNPVETP